MRPVQEKGGGPWPQSFLADSLKQPCCRERVGGMEKQGDAGRGMALPLALCLDHLSVSAFPPPLPLLRSEDNHPSLAEAETESQGSETAHLELAWGRVSGGPRLVWLLRPLLKPLGTSICVLSRVRLCDPTGCSPPGSSVHGIFQTRILEWVAISSSRGSSQSRDRARIACVSCITGRFFTR